MSITLHTNAIKDSMLLNIAKTEAKVLAEYFNLQSIQETVKPAPTPETTKIYRVQVGAYIERSNAEAMLEKLKKNGFEGFIVEVTK